MFVRNIEFTSVDWTNREKILGLSYTSSNSSYHVLIYVVKFLKCYFCSLSFPSPLSPTTMRLNSKTFLTALLYTCRNKQSSRENNLPVKACFVISFVKTVIKVDHSMKGASNQKIKYSRLNIIVFNSTLFNNASSAASQISLCRSC
jgi:hypothetical protein